MFDGALDFYPKALEEADSISFRHSSNRIYYSVGGGTTYPMKAPTWLVMLIRQAEDNAAGEALRAEQGRIRKLLGVGN